MDSLAYSVMLDMSVNTSSVESGMQKSLDMAKGFGKQINQMYSSSQREVKRLVDQHKGVNETLQEQEGIVGKIWSGFKGILSTVWSITKAIGASLFKAVWSVFSSTIGLVNTHINAAQKRFQELLEEWRFANIEAASGVSNLNDQMISLQFNLGVAYDESKKAVIALTEAGFRAKDSAEDYNTLAKTIVQFERITGVSSKTTAMFAKTVGELGMSSTRTSDLIESFAEGMARANLVGEEMSAIINSVREESYRLELAFGTSAIENYTKSLIDLAGAAKMVGVDISKATSLMSALNREPLKFIVALGSGGLYRSASENLEVLIDRVDEISGRIRSMPPGLQPQLLQSIYGLDMATLKVLESVKKFREEYPAISEFSKLWDDANKSVSRIFDMMYNKVMAIFEKIGAKFAKFNSVVMKLFAADLPQAVQRLELAMTRFINIAFSTDILEDFSDSSIEVFRSINDWLIGIIDNTTAWFDKLSTGDGIVKVRNFVNDIYDTFKNKIVPGAIEFARILWVMVGSAVNYLIEKFGFLYDFVVGLFDGSVYNNMVKYFNALGSWIKWIGVKGLAVLSAWQLANGEYLKSAMTASASMALLFTDFELPKFEDVNTSVDVSNKFELPKFEDVNTSVDVSNKSEDKAVEKLSDPLKDIKSGFDDMRESFDRNLKNLTETNEKTNIILNDGFRDPEFNLAKDLTERERSLQEDVEWQKGFRYLSEGMEVRYKSLEEYGKSINYKDGVRTVEGEGFAKEEFKNIFSTYVRDSLSVLGKTEFGTGKSADEMLKHLENAVRSGNFGEYFAGQGMKQEDITRLTNSMAGVIKSSEMPDFEKFGGFEVFPGIKTEMKAFTELRKQMTGVVNNISMANKKNLVDTEYKQALDNRNKLLEQRFDLMGQKGWMSINNRHEIADKLIESDAKIRDLSNQSWVLNENPAFTKDKLSAAITRAENISGKNITQSDLKLLIEEYKKQHEITGEVPEILKKILEALNTPKSGDKFVRRTPSRDEVMSNRI